jgi:hypothetical protein
MIYPLGDEPAWVGLDQILGAIGRKLLDQAELRIVDLALPPSVGAAEQLLVIAVHALIGNLSVECGIIHPTPGTAPLRVCG